MAPHPVDHHVGRRLRARRTMLGMSQENLGEAVGVTFQQIQKYERGLNRIGASRLYEFSKVLAVEVSYFFEDVLDSDPMAPVDTDKKISGFSEGLEFFEHEKFGNKEVLALVRSYFRIESASVRKQVVSLVNSLANTSLEEAEDQEDTASRRKA